jgi:hypothetical protein
MQIKSGSLETSIMADLRVVAYVDGFNLYYGMKAKGWGQFYWNDPHLLIQQLIRPGFRLDRVLYFTAKVKSPQDKRLRQKAYLDAIEGQSEAEVILGKFYDKPRTCNSCQHQWTSHEEKMTDTAIGVNLVADAFTDAFDVAFLVGGDTDIVPAIKMVKRHFPKKRLEAWFPPNRKNQAVADECDDEQQINGLHLEKAVMPDEIETIPGVVVRRPAEWVYRPPSNRARAPGNKGS